MVDLNPCTLMKSVRVECRRWERLGTRAGDAGGGSFHFHWVLLVSPDEAGVAPPGLGGGGDSHHLPESGVAVSTIISGVPLVISNLDDVMVSPAPPIAPVTGTSAPAPGRLGTTVSSFHRKIPDALKADLSAPRRVNDVTESQARLLIHPICRPNPSRPV